MRMLGRVLSTLSLLVAAAALVASVLSHVAPIGPTLVRSRPEHALFFSSRYGRVVVWTQSISPPPPSGCDVTLIRPYRFDVRSGTSATRSSFNPNWPRTDEGWDSAIDTTGTIMVEGAPYTFKLHVREVRIQWRLVFVVAAIAPAIRLTIWYIRRRPAQAGRCAVCGHDLRATPDRCPECGAIPRS